jgi:hypothetical protein
MSVMFALILTLSMAATMYPTSRTSAGGGDGRSGAGHRTPTTWSQKREHRADDVRSGRSRLREEDEGADDGSELPPADEGGEDNETVCVIPAWRWMHLHHGYWKNHAASVNGNQADEIPPLIEAAGGAIWLVKRAAA